MTGLRRRDIMIGGALAMAGAAPAGAQGAWPTKQPIRWVVPYTAGGFTDLSTRIPLAHVADALGQSVVVDNKPGANSIIGAEIVAKAPPDGYTMLTVIAAHAANATLYKGRLPFDAVKSFTPISLVTIAPLILTVANALPVKSVPELIAYAKANPGKVSFGSSGVGAAAHLTSELMKQVCGIEMTHVPYKGTAPALADLVAGNLHMLIDSPSGVMAQVRAGKIRALAMLSKERVPGADEVPTIVENGGPPIESSSWAMYLAPAGTPKDIVERLSAETAKALKRPDVAKRLVELGVLAAGYDPAASAAFLDAEIAKWGKVITAADVKIE
ncbi:MAG: tripartite tricarboxylate transporter substrate binding protein [Rhodospirillales bacterium]|nr:MAG: tripartite tricarboxylate transporter substrate binding protein [Rhodospirillales bacterium]